MFKDEVLNDLASSGANVAQFVSYDPNGNQRFARVRGVGPEYQFSSFEEAITAIHRTQSDPNVNIRTFLPDKPDGNPFFYGPKFGFRDPKVAAEKVRSLVAEGQYHLIVNETIDEADGGFSGVLFGDTFEFASRDIPRCVDKPGCAALPYDLSMQLIEIVYGFQFQVPYEPDFRVECSVHPGKVGYLGQRQVVWQAEKQSDAMPSTPAIQWPNRYSKDMGDKAFGLLIAHLLGFPVPFTTVFGRVIPCFSFGAHTENEESLWLRTCPSEQQPGLFTTSRRWLDPFVLMQTEDPTATRISSIIVQEGVAAVYSGAAITDAKGELVIEGKAGYGDSFMVGQAGPGKLPHKVKNLLRDSWLRLKNALGSNRFEWVYDGNRVWIVQLHVGSSQSHGNVIYPGDPQNWRIFFLTEGLEKLRALIPVAKETGEGIVLVGDVGITSHSCDLLRRDQVPSVLQRS